MTTIRDRIKDLRRVPASSLRRNPHNWRTHPAEQRQVMAGLLQEIGYADAVLARELPDGSLELLDGHLRADVTPDAEIPVLIVDLNDDEAKKLLATFDTVGGLAQSDDEALAALVKEVEAQEEEVRQFLALMLDDLEHEPVEVRPLSVKPPPKMAWVLIGIPVVRFGEIAGPVEQIAGIPGAIVETTANDGRKQ